MRSFFRTVVRKGEECLGCTIIGRAVVVGGIVTLGVTGYYIHKKYSTHNFPRMVKTTTTYSKTLSKDKPTKLFPESYMAGSEEHDMLFPKCQILIGSVTADNQFLAMGNGVRYLNHLITPEHVFATATALSSKFYVKGTRNEQTVLVEDVEYIHLAPDLIAIPLPDKVFSTIQVTEAGVYQGTACGDILATVVGVKRKGTTGQVTCDSSSFGRVIFKATTLAGYSGAPYFSTSRVVGIHTHGGAQNVGYSMSYVACQLKSWLKMKNEDSEEFLTMMHERGVRIRAMASEGDPDEIFVQVGNDYHTMLRSSFTSKFPDYVVTGSWYEYGQDDYEYEPRSGRKGKARRDYSDEEYEAITMNAPELPGESSPTNAGGSSQSTNSPVSADAQKLAKVLSKLLYSRPSKRAVTPTTQTATVTQICPEPANLRN